MMHNPGEITLLAIADLQAALDALKRDVEPVNQLRYQVMAEPMLDEIDRMIMEFISIEKGGDSTNDTGR